MVSRLRRWIAKKIALGEFSSRRDVLRFALSRTFWTVLAAVVLNFVIYRIAEVLRLDPVAQPDSYITDTIITAMVAGPIACLAFYIVGSAIHDLAVSRNEFERLSRTDPLTGLLNRRAFVDIIATMDEPYALAIFDIDRFKSINDTHGHAAGDQVLVEVAQMMSDTFGSRHPVARLGGEEFGMVLRRGGRKETVELVDSFRERLAARTFDIDGTNISVTISAGISQGQVSPSYSVLLSAADKALYLAKASGRNRIVHADEVANLLPLRPAHDGRIAV